MALMPAQKPGRSAQDFQTPPEFLAAVKHKLGIREFSIDVAADEHNTVAERWWDVEQNSFLQTWSDWPGWQWLNPPFAQLEPWVSKAYRESQQGAQIAMLVPAGVGSNWWRDWVHKKARVLLLNGRLCFISDWVTTIDPASLKPGKGPARCYTSPPLYPKDCCLLLYGPGILPDYEVWTWAEEIR